MFSTGRDIASITHLSNVSFFSRVLRQISPPISCLSWTLGVNYTLELKYLLFFQGSETNVPTYFLSALNTGRQLHTQRSNVSFFSRVVGQMSPPISCQCWTLQSNTMKYGGGGTNIIFTESPFKRDVAVFHRIGQNCAVQSWKPKKACQTVIFKLFQLKNNKRDPCWHWLNQVCGAILQANMHGRQRNAAKEHLHIPPPNFWTRD